MDTLGARIKHAITTAQLSQAEAARRLNTTPQAVNGWISTGKISLGNLVALSRLTGRSLAWFHSSAAALEQEPAAYTVDQDKYALIPRYEVQAGAGQPRENGHEEISGMHAYRRDWLERKGLSPGSCAVIEACGDSMLPTIADGDVVLINLAARRVINGAAFAFRTDEGPRIKRLFRQLDGRVRVVSDNPDKLNFPDEFLTPGMEAEIIGQVVHRSGGV